MAGHSSGAALCSEVKHPLQKQKQQTGRQETAKEGHKQHTCGLRGLIEYSMQIVTDRGIDSWASLQRRVTAPLLLRHLQCEQSMTIESSRADTLTDHVRHQEWLAELFEPHRYRCNIDWLVDNWVGGWMDGFIDLLRLQDPGTSLQLRSP